MRIKKNAVSKWILILTISNVSASEVFKFTDLKKEEVIANGLNRLEEVRKNDRKSNTKIVNALHKNNADSHIKNQRKSQDFHGFKYKKLVKRTIPHNYKTNDLEYDLKFKTLFKPLVRIHKKNPDLDRFSDGEDQVDLVYVIDDIRFDDAPNLDKDDNLLKPFSTDFGAFTSNDKKVIRGDYIVSNGIKLPDINYKPNKNRNKVIVSRGNIKTKPMRYVPANKNDESKYADSLKYGSDSFTGELRQILRKKSPYIFVLHDRHSYKPRKVTILDDKLKKMKNNLVKNNIIKKKPSITKNGLLFGPVGTIMSKQVSKNLFLENLLEDATIAEQELRAAQPIRDPDNLPGVLKHLIQKQRDKRAESNDDSESYESEKNDNIKSMFVGVGHVNSKQINWQDQTREEDTNHVKSFRQKKDTAAPVHSENINKLTLLKEIVKYQGNKEDKEKSLKHRSDEELRTLTHVKSGEEEEMIQIIKKTLDDDDVTTKEPVTWRPNYPFWNYWTYDKQIELDDCKGQLIQHGKICVGAWSRK